MELSCAQCGTCIYTPLSNREDGKVQDGYGREFWARSKNEEERQEDLERTAQAAARLTALAREMGMTPGDPEEPELLALTTSAA